jgi:hypothetical protein
MFPRLVVLQFAAYVSVDVVLPGIVQIFIKILDIILSETLPSSFHATLSPLRKQCPIDRPQNQLQR